MNDSINTQFLQTVLINYATLSASRKKFTNGVTIYIFTFHFHAKNKLLLTMMIKKIRVKVCSLVYTAKLTLLSQLQTLSS